MLIKTIENAIKLAKANGYEIKSIKLNKAAVDPDDDGVWLDGYLSDNSYENISFSSELASSVTQVEDNS